MKHPFAAQAPFLRSLDDAKTQLDRSGAARADARRPPVSETQPRRVPIGPPKHNDTDDLFQLAKRDQGDADATVERFMGTRQSVHLQSKSIADMSIADPPSARKRGTFKL